MWNMQAFICNIFNFSSMTLRLDGIFLGTLSLYTKLAIQVRIKYLRIN